MGTVTNPTGSMNGNNLSTLVDVYTGNWAGVISPPPPTLPQWQMVVMLGSSTDLCARVGMQGNGHYTPGEVTLRFALLAVGQPGGSAPVYPPAGDLPLTLPASATSNQYVTTSDSVDRYAKAYVNKASNNGNSGKDTGATGGTVTFTRMDAGSYEGSYNLTFPNGGTATGSFVSPWCGTPPS